MGVPLMAACVGDVAGYSAAVLMLIGQKTLGIIVGAAVVKQPPSARSTTGKQRGSMHEPQFAKS